MTIDFDPGYGAEPFRTLCRDFESAGYPADSFRLEWGPIFHRGRLDGSARVLAIGQDPATHETITRRTMIGTAGHRVQGFLAKLGLTKSYVIVNTFMFNVLSQSGGENNKNLKSIIDYRNRWFDALLAPNKIEGVVAFGSLAADAWTKYTATNHAAGQIAYQHVLHPTWPESSAAAGGGSVADKIEEMLSKWNPAVVALRAKVTHHDAAPDTHPYGATFKATELPDIPAADLPPGLPSWMRGNDGWCKRTGDTAAEKRRTLSVVVPSGVID